MKAFITTLIFSFALVISIHAQKRKVEVGSFTELSLGIPANVYIRQGSDEEVQIDCDDNVFEKIEFEKNGNRLIIKRENNGWNWSNGWSKSEVDIYIIMRTIERLSVSGSGNIESNGSLSTEDLELSVSGSGDIELDIDGDEVETRISGSGSIKLGGRANEGKARISGSGRVKAEELIVSSFEARISGSGSCYITVEEEIEASISGSGNVYYAGNPNRVIGNSSGSGKIKKM